MGKIQQLLNQSHIEIENLPKTLIDQSFPRSIVRVFNALGIIFCLSAWATSPTDTDEGPDIYSHGIDYDPVKLGSQNLDKS